MKTKCSAIILFVLFVCAVPVLSEVNPSEFDPVLDEELKWLRAESVILTEIATKTAMDADLVPGMVTIVHGVELVEKGVRTVYEALSLVPGFATSLNNTGTKHVLVRGVGGETFSGNLKLMIDGIALNESLSASGYVLYELPVEHVDKIEIIRGPGSVIYGEYAYAGVVNIMTRKANGVYGTYDSNGGYGLGGLFEFHDPEEEIEATLNLAGWETSGGDVEAGEDLFYGIGLGGLSHSPGPTNEHRKDRQMNLSLGYKKFSLKGQYLRSGHGDYFGLLQVLPPEDDRIVFSHEHKAVEAEYPTNLVDGLELSLKLGRREHLFQVDDVVSLPPNTIAGPDGSLAAPHYEEKDVYTLAELIWDGLDRHTVLVGMKHSKTEMENVWLYANSNPNFWGRMVLLTGDNNWLAEDRKRSIFSVYFQELFDATDNFSLTAGFRYDSFDDMGEYVTPRASMVYRLKDRHIFKAQFSEAVRPPTFLELYSASNSVFLGNPNLKSEKIRSHEAGYIYRNPNITGRLTVFYTELKDKIQYPPYADTFSDFNQVEYSNAGDIESKGFELELQYVFSKKLTLSGNLSYTHTKDDETGKPLPGASDWLANASLKYEPIRDFLLSFKYRHVDKRHRTPDDTRDKLAGYDTIDVSARIENLFTKGFSIQCGVSNLFDEDVVQPAPVYKDQEGNIGYYYEEDFPRQGREWRMQTSYYWEF